MTKTLKDQLEAQKKAAEATKTKTPDAAPTPPATRDEVVGALAVDMVKKPSGDAEFDAKVAAAVGKALAGQSGTIDYAKLGQAVGQAIVAAEAAKEMTAHQRLTATAKAKMAREEKCFLCGQTVGDGKNSGCGGPFKRDAKGNYITEPVLNPDGTQAVGPDDKPVVRRVEDFNQFHINRVVFPVDPMAYQCWDGITVNGAVYMSQGPGHKVWVPKGVNIDHLLAEYERGERDARIPKKRNRHSGSLNGKTGGHEGPGVGAGWTTQ